MKYVKRMHGMLFRPAKFFASAKKEKGFVKPLVFLAAFITINNLVGVAVNPFMFSAVGIPLYFLLNIMLFLIGASVLHVFAKISQGKGDYNDSFKSFIYGMAPLYVFGWLSSVILFLTLENFTVGLAVSLSLSVALFAWSIYNSIKGLRVLHSLPRAKSFFCILIAVLSVIIAGTLVSFLASGSISGIVG